MKFDTQKIKQDFSRAANTYDAESDLQRNVLERLVAMYARDIPHATHLLDAGCGTGYLAEILTKHKQPYDLWGCDLAFGMCQKTAEQRFYTQVANASLEHLPYADRVFDVVLSSLTLQWVNDPVEALHECFRVTKPDGELWLTTFGTHTLKEMKNVFSMLDDDPHVSAFYTQAQMTDMLKLVGYQAIELQTQSYRHFAPSFLALARHLKAIGATNKRLDRSKRLMSQTQLRKLDEFYHLFYRQPEGLPVTWEVHFLRARK